MVEATTEERDEFGPKVSAARFVGLLALLLFCGNGLLELERVAVDPGWAGSNFSVHLVRIGLFGGLTVGAAAACVAFGRVRRDLFHRGMAWFALILVGPLASLIGSVVVASAFGVFTAPSADDMVLRWARSALQWVCAGGMVALGLRFRPREPDRTQRLRFAAVAGVAAVVLAIAGREFELDELTSPARYACVLPLLIRARTRDLPEAVVMATAVLGISGPFVLPDPHHFGAQYEVVLCLGLWLGVALPLVLARRYDALGVDVDDVDSRSTRRGAGAAVLLLLVSPLVAIGRGASTLPPPPRMPPTIWFELTKSSESDGDEITLESFADRWRITLSPGGPPLISSAKFRQLAPMDTWDRSDEWWRETSDGTQAGSRRWVYVAGRAWQPSGLAALLPRARAYETVAVFESADEPEIHGGRRYLRFDLRPDDGEYRAGRRRAVCQP